MDIKYKLYNINELKPGDHLCCLYETDEEHKVLITPYLRSGLENNEKVFYIVDARTSEAILNYLHDDGIDVDPYLESGQLTILTANESYMKGGVFDPDGMIQMLTEETNKALKEGYTALRVTGEMSWALRGLPGSERLIEYETRLNEFFPNNKALAICQYDCRVFEPEILLDILTTHPIAVIGTEIYENFYYIPTEDFLAGKAPEKTLEHWKDNLKNRRIMEKNLTESEDKYHSIFENSMDAVLLTNPNGEILDVNPAAEKLFGYSKKSILKLGRYGLIDSDDPRLPALIKEREYKGKTKGELFFIKKDGSKFPAEISSNIFKDRDGNLRTSMVIRDISDRLKAEDALKKSEERYSVTLDAVNDGLWDWNVISGEAFFSPNYYKLLGYEPGEFPANYSSWLLLLHTDDIDPVEKQLKKSIKYGRGFEIDLRMKTKSNKWLWVSTRGKAIEKDSTGTSTRMVGTLSDITSRKNAELALIESEEKFREVFNNANDAIFLHKLVDGDPGKFLEVNDVACQILGYSRDELLNMSPMDIDTPETIVQTSGIMEILLKNGENTFEAVQVAKDGELLPVEINAHIFTIRGEKYVLSISRDIRERKNMETQLKKSLEEKEMLLKEIHHRVKNNLMIISSLLNLQSSYIKDKQSQDIFKESQNRARSMALIHERLYQSTDLKRIDFGDYITSLANELFHTYVADPSLIELEISVDDIDLDINTAIPLGLIVNELITNSLKHAFLEGMEGTINIDFHPLDEHYKLTVKDNGIGFPEGLDYQNTDSLGLQIVTNLTEQIDGVVELNSNNGTEFNITFKQLKL